jgi:hypothetical protein
MQAGGNGQPCGRAVGIICEPAAGQRAQLVADQAGRGFERGAVRVGEPHIPSGAGEDRGPDAADQTGADDGDGFVSLHILSL